MLSKIYSQLLTQRTFKTQHIETQHIFSLLSPLCIQCVVPIAGKATTTGRGKEDILFILQKRFRVQMGVQLQAVLITQDKHHSASGLQLQHDLNGLCQTGL